MMGTYGKSIVVEQSEWCCYLFGGGLDTENYGLCWRPAKGTEPNAFWRWMQYVCFGNRWVKDKEDEIVPCSHWGNRETCKICNPQKGQMK